MATIIGIKKGMTSIYNEQGRYVPVTIVDVEGSYYAKKSSDGYEVGLGKKRGGKTLQGQYKELGFVPKFKTFVKGVVENLKVGEPVDLSAFEDGKKVRLVTKSKGKGFAGVVKRWGFAGGKRTHGQSDRLRAPGSIGSGTTPGRVLKGKKMAGRMGGDKLTVKSKIVKRLDSVLLIKGPVPGAKGYPVIISVEDTHEN